MWRELSATACDFTYKQVKQEVQNFTLLFTIKIFSLFSKCEAKSTYKGTL